MTDINSKKWHQAFACRQNLLLNVFKFVFVSVFKFEISKTCNLCQTLPSVFFFFFLHVPKPDNKLFHNA